MQEQAAIGFYSIEIDGQKCDIEIPTRKMTKKRITVEISEEVVERLKNAVFWTPGLTLAGVIEESLSVVLACLEEERGEPFPQRTTELKTGRPVG